MKNLLRSLFVISLTLNLMSCSSKKTGTVKMLNFHIPVQLTALDPHKMEDAFSMLVNIQIYRGLFRYLPDGKLKPDLVDSYTFNKDQTEYIFHLKKEAIFSNHTPITALNVQQSIARIYFLGSSIGADLDYISGVELFKKTKNITDLGIKVIDEKTLSIHLSHPTNMFIKHLATADCAIFPLIDFKDPLPKVYSGPFEVSSFDPKKVELNKWRTDPFDSKSSPQKIVFFYSTESVTSLAEKKLTDWIVFDHVSIDKQAELMKKGWLHTSGELTLENFLIASPIHYNLATRKKIYSIIQSLPIIENLPLSGLQKAYGLIPPIFQGVLDQNDSSSVIELAAKSDTFQKDIIFEYNGNVEITSLTAKIIESALVKNGFKVTMIPLSADVLLDKMFSKKGHLILGRKGVDYPDPVSILNYFKSKIENNYFYTNSTELDQELSQLIQTDNEISRTKLIKSAQLKILKEFTTIPLYFGSDSSSLWSEKFKQIPPFPVGPHMLPIEMLEVN